MTTLNPWPGMAIMLTIFTLIVVLILEATRPRNSEFAGTWKFRTVVYLSLAFVASYVVAKLFLFAFLVTFPMFLYFASRSYAAGKASPPSQSSPPSTKAELLTQLHALIGTGALSQAEYEVEKQKVLTT